MRRALALIAAFVVAFATPASAARPLVDKGNWDRVFALFAREGALPWKRIAVRLDTYSGAPVDLAAYEVDPADVLVAGGKPRALDLNGRRPVVRWRFAPPPGLTYEINDVEVPLRGREGFFVIEARRGDASQQVWLNVTRIGLLTKESPGGIVVWGVDLGTGRALAGMRVSYLVGSSLVTQKTDAHGISRPPSDRRARFVLAEWGKSRAFATFAPAPPVPGTVVGVRVDRSSVRAGEHLRVIGFARRRSGDTYRPASGDAHVALLARGRQVASAAARLDAAGAFVADLSVAAGAPAGDAAVIATAGGASSGAPVHIDALGDVALAVAAPCTTACAPDADVPLNVSATRDGAGAAAVDVRVRVVRTPHVVPQGGGDEPARWGTSVIVDRTLRTDARGIATTAIPAPTDGLPSTYGVIASAGGASASAQLVAPGGKIALEVVPERTAVDPGETVGIAVRGFDAADGTPAANLPIRVRIAHGPTTQETRAVLDAQGRTRVVFRNVAPGTQLATAEADVDGKRIADVAAISVEPGAFGSARAQRSVEIVLTTDRARYRPGEKVAIQAELAGSAGDAFVSLDGVRPLADAVVPVVGNRVTAMLTLPTAVGGAEAAVAFVRDGALVFSVRPFAVDGPGHVRAMTLATRGTLAPGATTRVTIDDGGENAGATLAIRVADGRPSDGARFEDVAQTLTAAGTTTQDTAGDDPAWHAGVAPQRSTALDVFSSDRPRETRAAEQIVASGAQAVVWRVDRQDREGFDLALPARRGRYLVSVLKIADDGDVGAATIAVVVP